VGENVAGFSATSVACIYHCQANLLLRQQETLTYLAPYLDTYVDWEEKHSSM
jgi:hypothetical protein